MYTAELQNKLAKVLVLKVFHVQLKHVHFKEKE